MIARRQYRSTRGCRAAFTMVEMLITVAVILILLGIALPSVTSMWAQYRENDANGAISGLLMTSRARAIEGESGETGLLFYLDSARRQRIIPITRDPIDIGVGDWRTDPDWENVFTVAEEDGRTLLAPIRVVPRYIADRVASGTPKYEEFSAEELSNDSFEFPTVTTFDQAQRHRNFFAVVFNADGELDFARNVIIRDPDWDEDGAGDFTGLPVSDEAQQFYLREGGTAPLCDYAGTCPPAGVPTTKWDIIVGADDPSVAINFKTVDGLMVYDDAEFAQAGTPEEKRQYLLDTATPYYIHRISGAVVRGPVGQPTTN